MGVALGAMKEPHRTRFLSWYPIEKSNKNKDDLNPCRKKLSLPREKHPREGEGREAFSLCFSDLRT
jgi:hypothetical protein